MELNKIDTIKTVRAFSELSLGDAKDMVEFFLEIEGIEKISTRAEYTRFLTLMRKYNDGEIVFENRKFFIKREVSKADIEW